MTELFNVDIIELNQGQLNVLRGEIAEKIASMRMSDIERLVISSLGNSWVIWQDIMGIDDWLCVSASGISIVDKRKGEIIFSATDPFSTFQKIKEVLNTDQCYFLTAESERKMKRAKEMLENLPPDLGVPDMKLLVFKVGKERTEIERHVKLYSLNKRDSNQPPEIDEKIVANARIIKDVKPVFIEIKNIARGIKLKPCQQKLLSKAKSSNEFFYFIFNLKVDLDISPRIIIEKVFAGNNSEIRAD